MTFNPTRWRPIAIGLGVVNLVAMGFAAGMDQPSHAAVHAVLALGFGFWSQRMRRAPAVSDTESRLDALEDDAADIRGQLGEVQERLDFAERLLAQDREPRRVSPERDRHPPM